MSSKKEQQIRNRWEILRNSSWQEQEKFVQTILNGYFEMIAALEFLAEDKYSSNTGFKNIDGTVGEHCYRTLDWVAGQHEKE